MDYNKLLDLATDLGYELAMSGAETFRVEESISRVLAAYGIEAEVFAIPNYLIVSIHPEVGQPITRMRRIGMHGNDLDSVEKFSGLSRAYCNRKPEPAEGLKWMDYVRSQKLSYSTPMYYLGNFLGAAGYSLFFGGNLLDAICGGICGMLIGFIDRIMSNLKANQFFRTITESFLMAMLAYCMGTVGITRNPDAVIIGALMILVPGLLFTNAMRDIIYGDTNSGINRIVQVFLIAAALALGTATAWNLMTIFGKTPLSSAGVAYPVFITGLFAFIGCIGFSILFNIHGPGGILCAVGGLITWLIYCTVLNLGGGEIAAAFWGGLGASFYAEIMARIRKYPAFSYLVISIFPLIPGAGVYYTMNYAVRGEMELFASKGMHTAATAGIIAVSILLVSTLFRIYSVWKNNHHIH